jgi:hypothetical protein
MCTTVDAPTTTKHTFSIFIHEDAKSPITTKMALCIEGVVNQITKQTQVIQLPVDEFEDTFLVRMASHSSTLSIELEKGIISHIAHVSLRCEDPNKKLIMFGVWKRLKTSEVLK